MAIAGGYAFVAALAASSRPAERLRVRLRGARPVRRDARRRAIPGVAIVECVVIGFARLLLVAATLLGCVSHGVADGRFSVTFISPGRTGEVFWDMTAASMQAAADQLGIEL